MIRNQWYVVLDSKQVKDRPVGVTRMGEKLVFWRNDQGQLICFRDRCPHRGVALSKGQVVDGHLQCPFHGFEFDVSGRVVLIPANGRQATVPKSFQTHRYPTHEAHGWIWIWWGQNPPEDLARPRFFDNITADMAYATIIDPWDTHYSRVLENQLDVVHLPFIHRNSIGRSIGKVVDGPGTLWIDDDYVHVYTFNRDDDGTPPRKPGEVPVPDPTKDFRLELIMPNLWQNRLGEQARIVAAFVPVDDEHTLVYLRFYQKFVKLPLLRDLVAWAAMPFNRRVLHEDRAVVQTHQPTASGLRIGEKLITGDRPIVEYRRRRETLQAAARAKEGEE